MENRNNLSKIERDVFCQVLENLSQACNSYIKEDISGVVDGIESAREIYDLFVNQNGKSKFTEGIKFNIDVAVDSYKTLLGDVLE
jgi:hypothetical protein